MNCLSIQTGARVLDKRGQDVGKDWTVACEEGLWLYSHHSNNTPVLVITLGTQRQAWETTHICSAQAKTRETRRCESSLSPILSAAHFVPYRHYCDDRSIKTVNGTMYWRTIYQWITADKECNNAVNVETFQLKETKAIYTRQGRQKQFVRLKTLFVLHLTHNY